MTVVSPNENSLPEAALYAIIGLTPLLSVAVAASKLTILLVCYLTFAGHVTVGAWLSMIVTSNLHITFIPLLCVPFTVTVVLLPIGNGVFELWE